MLGVRPLMMPRFDLISKWSRPIPPWRAARRTGVLIRNPTGSGRCSGCTSVTVEDVNLLLDHSGCRMVPSGSTPEGQWRCPQHCKTNAGTYNTVRALTCLEGLKAPVLSYPDGTFLQTCKVWSSVLWLTGVPRLSCARSYERAACRCQVRRSLPLDVERGRAFPRMSGEAESALRSQAMRSHASDIVRGRVCPQTSSEAELALGRRARRSLPSDVG